MPKNALNIGNFSGGLNDNSNHRDINDFEFQLLNGIDVEIPGKFRLMGYVEDTSNHPVSGTADHIGSSTVNYGNGLMHLNLDRRLASAVNTDNTQHLLINDPSAQLIKVLDVDNNTLYATGDWVIDYGSTGSSRVEYVVIDGEVRVSPYVNGTLPFLTTNQMKKLKFIKTIKTLGADETDISNALRTPTTYNSVYKYDNAYIAPIKANPAAKYGEPDGYGYDVEGVMGTSTWFKPEYESEATCNTVFSEGNINDTTVYEVDKSLQNVTANTALGQHADWGDVYGGLELCIWLGSTINTSSVIYNYHDSSYGYEIFASNVYGNQESVPVHIGSVIEQTITGQSEDKPVVMYYSIIGRIPKNPFQTGINYYWAKKEDGEIGLKYLLFEVDFEKGYRKGGEKSYEVFAESHSSLTGDAIYCSNILTYASGNNKISGYGKGLLTLPDLEPWIEVADTALGRAGTGYKTATVINRRVYAGNVAYYDKKSEDTAHIKNANDTVIKSPVNEFDYFPLDNRIDVEINDGEDIVKLASVGDKLLEFKEHTLYVINCSRDLEYLEGTYNYKGVAQPYHVVEGEGFVGWINQYGAYVYEGERIVNILYNDIGQKKLKDWNTVYYHSTQSVLGYLPHKQSLIIGNKNGKVLIYDLKSGAWMYSSNKFPTNDITNMITLNDGNCIWYEKESTTLKIHRWNDVATGLTLNDGTVLLKTKDFTMGTPDVRKKIHSIYINYKHAGTIGTSDPNAHNTEIEIWAVPDKGTARQLETDGTNNATAHTLQNTNNLWTTLRINMAWTKATLGTDYFKDVKSLELQFVSNGSAIDSTFEVNDMQIVYREKTRK